MLAYAAHRPHPLHRKPAPHAMLGIIAAHVGLVAVVMSAKMVVLVPPKNPPLIVDLIQPKDPPPPNPVESVRASPQPAPRIERVQPTVPTPAIDLPVADPTPAPLPNIADMVRPLPDLRPTLDPKPANPVRQAARLLTGADDLKPPYPRAKLASGEEATLRLRLSIDPRGRVTAVDAVGPADAAFLEAARRHLTAHWRYKAASEDGRAVASSVVITLRFQLEG